MIFLKQSATWLLTCLLSVLWITLLWPSASDAQGLPTRAIMPEEIVLVFKTTGEEAVQPTTGVIVGRSRNGEALVVVPASFLADELPVFVLDVGSDLIRDGLAAAIHQQSPDSPLAVIAVPGMQRRAAKVTFNPPDEEHEVRLAAWPPADMMASRAPPYWIPVDVASKRTGAPQALLGNSVVPNLTGPLIDLCGHLAGMVIANGEPGAGIGATPQVLLNDELLREAETLELDLQFEACTQIAPTGSVAIPQQSQSGMRNGEGNQTPLENLLKDANLGMGAIVFVLSAVISGIIFWVLVKRRAAAQRRQKLKRTLAQETMTFSATGLPTRLTREEPKTFNPGTRPPGTNGWLRIEGSHADGRPLRAVTAITEGKFQAVIGRAGVALSADGPGISRKHAVIMSEGGRLTISDLGSRNGTFVNGVRCQPDEVFYIEPGDKLLIGAAQVTVTLKPVQDA